MSSLKEFDLKNPPSLRENTLLEASAGTGKTYTLVRIVRDLIAKQGIPLNKILIVTYTVPATEELKERIQEVLKESLADPAYTSEERERLSKSYLDCDSSPIYTIHSFCTSVIQTHPFESSAPFKMDIDNSGRLLDEVLRDYLQEVLAGADQAHLNGFLKYMDEKKKNFESSFSTIRTLVDSVLQNPHVHIFPQKGFSASWDFLLKTLEEVPRRLNIRKRNQGILDFSGMIESVYRALVPEETRKPELIKQLRKQYSVALIDEFQDTDTGQWGIFSTLFLDSPHHNLFLIGDPKQSIYGFRGTDLEVYFSARKAIEENSRFLLGGNYRSCPPLVEGLNSLFSELFKKSYNGSLLEFVPVEARAETMPLKDSSGQSAAPVEFLEFDVPVDDEKETAGIGVIRDGAYEALANRCSELLNSSFQYEGRPLVPDDVAILTDKNDPARELVQMLRDRQIPAVFIGDTNICDTEEYSYFISLFQALSAPDSPGFLKELLMTPFFSMELSEMLRLDREGGLDHYFFLLSQWREQVDNGAFLSVMETLFKEQNYRGRMASTSGGERALTNTRQILQMIQEEQKASRLDCRGIFRGLKERLWNSVKDDDFKLIHERESGCVTVMTVHKSKGLEFPVVLYAAGFYCPVNRSEFFTYIDPDTGLRMKDYTKSTSRKKHDTLYGWEELRRVYYVGMTRPKSLLVLPFTRVSKASQPYLLQSVYASFFRERLTDYVRDFGEDYIKKIGDPFYMGSSFGSKEKGERGRAMVGEFLGDEIVRTARSDPRTFRVQKAPPFSCYQGEDQSSNEPLVAPEEPDYNEIRKRIIPVSSFTSLVSHSHSSDFSEVLPATEKDFQQEDSRGGQQDQEIDNPFLSFRGGAVFGELVHQILENIPFGKGRLPCKEFAVDDAVQDLVKKTTALFFSSRWSDIHGDNLYNLIWTVLNTELPEGLYLKDLPEKDQFAEMEFLFYTEQGFFLPESASGNITVDKGAVKGYIDLVYRWKGRYFIIDWKTNLPPEGFNGMYTRECMETIIDSHRYDLQYKLYMAALIKQLQVIYPRESVDSLYQNYIGGVRYIFVRGAGQGDNGLYSDMPPLNELPFIFKK